MKQSSAPEECNMEPRIQVCIKWFATSRSWLKQTNHLNKMCMFMSMFMRFRKWRRAASRTAKSSCPWRRTARRWRVGKHRSRTLWLHVLELTTCFGPVAQDRSTSRFGPKPTSQHQKYLPVKATNQLPKNIDKHKPQRVAILSSVSWCPLVLTEGPSGSFVSAAFVCPFLRFAANVRISSVVKFNVRKECIGLGFWSAFQLQSSPSRWMATLWGHSFAWGCVRLTYCTKHLAAPGHLPLLHHGLALGGRRINSKV